MKRIVLSALIVLASVAVSLALFGTGWGKLVTVTGDYQQVAGFTANSLSVYNSGAGLVKCLANISTNDFATRVAAGTHITIPSGGSYTFDGQGNAQIENVCLVTSGASSTNVCYLAGF